MKLRTGRAAKKKHHERGNFRVSRQGKTWVSVLSSAAVMTWTHCPETIGFSWPLRDLTRRRPLQRYFLREHYEIERRMYHRTSLNVQQKTREKEGRIGAGDLFVHRPTVLPDLKLTFEKRSSPSTSVHHVFEDMALPSFLMRNMSKLEMVSMSVAGAVFSLGVVASLSADSSIEIQSNLLDELARFGNDISSSLSDMNNLGNVISTDGVDIVEETAEELGEFTKGLVTATAPTSVTDVLAASLGEGIAGILGVFATTSIGNLLMPMQASPMSMLAVSKAAPIPADVDPPAAANRRFKLPFITNSVDKEQSSTGMVIPPMRNRYMEDGIVTEAIADADYFLTRAALFPILQALGFPSFVASLFSVLLATVPYELIKLNSRLRRTRGEEERILRMLLAELREEEERRNTEILGRLDAVIRPIWRVGMQAPMTKSSDILGRATGPIMSDSSVYLEAKRKAQALSRSDKEQGKLVSLDLANDSFDWVEQFSDVTKWLEYEVLRNDFGGMLTSPLNGMKLSPGEEGALFGFLAALSSQLYADIIYRYTSQGSETARMESRTRTVDGWINLYSRKCFDTASLFGVYELLRVPFRDGLLGLLSGGFDNCVGSQNFQFCVDTYLQDNPPSASSRADELQSIRAFLADFLASLGMDSSMDFQDAFRSVVHDWYVWLNSLPLPH